MKRGVEEGTTAGWKGEGVAVTVFGDFMRWLLDPMSSVMKFILSRAFYRVFERVWFILSILASWRELTYCELLSLSSLSHELEDSSIIPMS